METQFRKAYNVITDEEGNKTIVYPITTADLVKIETSNIEDQPLDLQKFFNKIKNAAYRDIGEIIDTKSMDIDFSNGGTARTYNKSAINKGFKDIKTTVETIEKTIASFEKNISSVENFEKEIVKYKASIEKLKLDIINLENSINTIQSSIVNLGVVDNELRDKEEANTNSINILSDHITELGNSIRMLNGTLNEHTSSIENLNSRMVRLEEKIDNKNR